jgi:pimeloyl-ACP methyl ester carboxylesterase
LTGESSGRGDRAAAEVPGDVTVLGGRAVHVLHRPGTGAAVVLLGGCGVPYYTWDSVLAALPELDGVTLDRPGLVGTHWPRVLPRLGDEVATLSDLIHHLGGGPVALVAHSMAGFHVEALAREHPALVAAVVLVDSSVEWAPRRPVLASGWLWVARGVQALFGLPAVRPAGSFADRVLVAHHSRRKLLEPRSATAKAVYRSRDAAASVVAEQGAYGQQAWDLSLLRRRTSFPDIPVVVVSATTAEGSRSYRDHARLAELLGGDHRIAADSGHLVMVDRPDLVAAAVRSVVSS